MSQSNDSKDNKKIKKYGEYRTYDNKGGSPFAQKSGSTVRAVQQRQPWSLSGRVLYIKRELKLMNKQKMKVLRKKVDNSTKMKLFQSMEGRLLDTMVELEYNHRTLNGMNTTTDRFRGQRLLVSYLFKRTNKYWDDIKKLWKTMED